MTYANILAIPFSHLDNNTDSPWDSHHPMCLKVGKYNNIYYCWSYKSTDKENGKDSGIWLPNCRTGNLKRQKFLYNHLAQHNSTHTVNCIGHI